MNTKQAKESGHKMAALIRDGKADEAYRLLAPILAERTPFRLLDLIGGEIGKESIPLVNPFLEKIATFRTEGGWVVIATALNRQYDRDPSSVFERTLDFIISADIWYAADIFGERVPGPALISDFPNALQILKTWRNNPNRWIRRTTGVAVHYRTKRTLGDPIYSDQIKMLLEFLEPLFEEREMDAVKGIGWALKTLGRYFPAITSEWLTEQIARKNRPHRAIMRRKALKFLSEEQKLKATGGQYQ